MPTLWDDMRVTPIVEIWHDQLSLEGMPTVTVVGGTLAIQVYYA